MACGVLDAAVEPIKDASAVSDAASLQMCILLLGYNHPGNATIRTVFLINFQ